MRSTLTDMSTWEITDEVLHALGLARVEWDEKRARAILWQNGGPWPSVSDWYRRGCMADHALLQSLARRFWHPRCGLLCMCAVDQGDVTPAGMLAASRSLGVSISGVRNLQLEPYRLTVELNQPGYDALSWLSKAEGNNKTVEVNRAVMFYRAIVENQAHGGVMILQDKAGRAEKWRIADLPVLAMLPGLITKWRGLWWIAMELNSLGECVAHRFGITPGHARRRVRNRTTTW